MIRAGLGHDPNSPAELGHVATQGNLHHLRNLRLIPTRSSLCLGVLVVKLLICVYLRSSVVHPQV
jgi:hypothetical protein